MGWLVACMAADMATLPSSVPSAIVFSAACITTACSLALWLPDMVPACRLALVAAFLRCKLWWVPRHSSPLSFRHEHELVVLLQFDGIWHVPLRKAACLRKSIVPNETGSIITPLLQPNNSNRPPIMQPK